MRTLHENKLGTVEERITLVMDNLNTHKPGSLYEVFGPEEAKRLWVLNDN